MKSQNGLSAKGESSRERILAHSKELFLDQGYDALILRRIAETLDMKLSNVQYYFQTKEDLVTAIIESEERFDIALLQSAMAKFAEPEAVVRYVVNRFLKHWRGRSGAIFIAREFFALNNPAINLTKKDTDAIFYREIETLIRRFKPDVDAAEARKRRRLVVSLLDGGGLHSDPGALTPFARSIEDLIIAVAKAE